EVAAHRDHAQVRASPACVRPRLSERRERAQDQPRVPRMQNVPAEAARTERPGRPGLEDHVGTVGEAQEELPARRTLELEGATALRPVEREPQERALGILDAAPEGRPPPGWIARGWL